jgi:pimeloyl-ACP methyl ester carboxylesterase
MPSQWSRSDRGRAGGSLDPTEESRPGRFTFAERRAALAAPADMEGFTSRWHQTSAVRLHIRQRSTSTFGATPCVLLHGLAVSHRYLMPTARAQRNRAVYLPDLAGFGLSGKPANVVDVGGHARILAEWLDAAGIGRVALLGNSFGCQVAVELAHRRPDLVAALILVGPTTDPAAASVTGQLRRWLLDLPFEDPRQIPVLAADLRDAGVRRVTATLRLAVRDRITAKLAAIRVPTLLVRGAHDRIAPQSWLDHLATLVPDAEMRVLHGAAHNAVTTAGPELAAAVDRFLANG